MNGIELLTEDPLCLLIILWSLPWKAVSLWKAAKNDDKAWYIALLFINLAGLLSMLYIFYFSKKKASPENKSVGKKKK